MSFTRISSVSASSRQKWSRALRPATSSVKFDRLTLSSRRSASLLRSIDTVLAAGAGAAALSAAPVSCFAAARLLGRRASSRPCFPRSVIRLPVGATGLFGCSHLDLCRARLLSCGLMRPKPPVSAAANAHAARTPTAAAAATMAPMGRLRAAGCSSRPENSRSCGLRGDRNRRLHSGGPGQAAGRCRRSLLRPDCACTSDVGVWGTVGSAASTTASATPVAPESRATASRGTTRSTGAPQFVQNFTSSAIWLPHRVQNISTDLPAPRSFLPYCTCRTWEQLAGRRQSVFPKRTSI